MKVIQLIKYGQSDSAFKVDEVDDPICKNNEVLIEVECFGLNFADIMARKKLYKAAPPLPCVLGYEVVGRIVKVGNTENNLFIGKRVLAFTRFGAYAQKVKVLHNAIVEVQDNDDAASLTALATQYCTAYYASTIATTVQKGDVVLQHAAAGGVGIALTQLCKLSGAKVIGLVSSDKKSEVALKNGCDETINISKSNYIDVLHKKKCKPDIIFNSVAGKSFHNDLQILNKGGRLVCYGAADRLNGGASFLSTLFFVLRMKRIVPVKLLMKSQGVIGVNMLEIAEIRPEILEKSLNVIMDLYRKNLIHPLVFKSYDYHEIGVAHHDLENRNTTGKLAVFW